MKNNAMLETGDLVKVVTYDSKYGNKRMRDKNGTVVKKSTDHGVKVVLTNGQRIFINPKHLKKITSDKNVL